TYQPTKEEIGVGEALLPPVITGAVGGLLWYGIYSSASDLAAGKEIEIRGRRQGMKRMLVWVAELLGPTGATVLGVALLVLIVGWLAMRIIRRPQRTVWLPEKG